MTDKNSFKLYVDYKEVFDALTDKQAGQLIKAIFEHESGGEPALSGILYAVFSPIKQQLDIDRERGRCGEHHWNWKGGITPENRKDRTSPEYREWRKCVFERDNFTCQVCGRRGGTLHAHHKKRFSRYKELRFSPDNGIALCNDCHDALHRGELK